MQTNCCVIGIDIGGTTTSFGFVDCYGTIISKSTLATQASQPAHDLAFRLCNSIEELRTTLPSQMSVLGIGIGAPDANHHRGTVENPTNLNWGESVNLVELFRQYFDVPIVVSNDANAAAIGELLFGGARGMKHAIVITLGTGLGSGIVVNGELLYGFDGFAGEIGQTIVDSKGRHCPCGRQGCLETYVSASGLCRTVFELMAQQSDPSCLRGVSFNNLSSKQIFDAANEGDPLALKAFDMTARILGIKLADAVAILSPEAIILSGGLAEAGDLLIVPTRRYLEEFLYNPIKGKITLKRSELATGSSAILGAAALIWSEVKRLTQD